MKNIKQGDTVKIEGIIDACRTGLKKKEYRVKIGDVTFWIPAEMVETEEEHESGKCE